MPIRARLVFDADDLNKVINVRYYGDVDGSTILSEISRHLTNMTDPWTYDAIFDMRRFEGFVVLNELAGMSAFWQQMSQGRDKGRLTAFVSFDPLVQARHAAYETSLPGRINRVFDNMDEAIEWIKAERRKTGDTSGQKLAS